MKTLSFINMKGGVGKTTSVVEVATILATRYNKKVLVIDLDPQTNATLSFITLEEWEKVKDTSTIADVLGMNRGASSRDEEFDIKNAIIKNAGNIPNLDLIPSHLELTFLDLDIASRTARESVLKNQFEKANLDYDFVIIDCPPNLTLAPQNALMISDYIIVPVVPEMFPAIGLPLLINRVKKLKRDLRDCKVDFLGAVFTKVDVRYSVHNQQINALRQNGLIPCFTTIIKQLADINKAVAENKPATMKFPNGQVVEAYNNFVKEILNKIEENGK
ncbi:MAG: ParA family protein [Prevotellaceae bacterium]|jgi:chromosome partitioning protein|nr:ParA family protein [Prevotellaceae bacterium]